MALIETKKLSKQFKQGAKIIKAVDNVDLKIEKGDFVLVVGPSGCGKSTLMQLLGGLERPTSGELILDGLDITKIKEDKLTKLRQKTFGFIFQNYNLIPTLTAFENVEAALARPSKNDSEKVIQALKQVGLSERVNHLPSRLSGGEQQRVAIARALINDPEIILADEPTGNLDSKTSEEILKILEDLNKNKEKTIILVTHAEEARKIASRFLKMHDGKIAEIRNLSP